MLEEAFEVSRAVLVGVGGPGFGAGDAVFDEGEFVLEAGLLLGGCGCVGVNVRVTVTGPDLEW